MRILPKLIKQDLQTLSKTEVLEMFYKESESLSKEEIADLILKLRLEKIEAQKKKLKYEMKEEIAETDFYLQCLGL